MQNVKQMREKYENLKQLNPNIKSSARSSYSQTPSKQQYDAIFNANGSQKIKKQQPIIQIGRTLLCSPCYNKRLLNQKQQIAKQESQLERNQHLRQLEIYQKEEQEKINSEINQISFRKQAEQQNLEISKQYLKAQQENERKWREQEIEEQKQIIKQNQELEQKEKAEKERRQKSLMNDLKSQIDYQCRQKKSEILSQSAEMDDPYWRYQTQEEKEVQRRKHFQEEYVNHNWGYFEQEQKRKKMLEKQAKERDIEVRIQELQQFHTKLEQEKQEKQKIQKQLIMDLNAQVKLKKQKEEAQRLLDLQKQRSRDQETLKQEQERQYREINNRKKVSQEMVEGLTKQVEFQKQTSVKNKAESRISEQYLLKSSIDKVLLPCSDCQKKQEPQLLSQL